MNLEKNPDREVFRVGVVGVDGDGGAREVLLEGSEMLERIEAAGEGCLEVEGVAKESRPLG